MPWEVVGLQGARARTRPVRSLLLQLIARLAPQGTSRAESSNPPHAQAVCRSSDGVEKCK